MVNFAFGQKDNPYDFYDWVGKDFIENEINSTSTYIYKLDDNGNIKDSVLFYIKQFDISENKIFGTKYNTVFEIFHTNFETYYNVNGQIIKKKYTSNSEDGSWNDNGETNYEYDSLNREIKTTNKYYRQHYSFAIDFGIEEFVYNSNNQIIEFYQTDYTKPKTKSNPYNQKYLSAKWKYDSLSNLIEFTSFARLYGITDIKNYFYDDQNRLVKETHSNSSFMLKIITYEYTDTGKIVETTSNVTNPKMMYKTTSYHDKEDKIVRHCYIKDSQEDCVEYFYYENNKLTKQIRNTVWGSVDVTTYSYNEKGLLKEEQTSKNDKITNLIRYYYE